VFLLTFHMGDEPLHVEEFLGVRSPISFMFFSVPEITGLLAQAGFADVQVTERDPYPDVEYQSRRAYVMATKKDGQFDNVLRDAEDRAP
jgi:hypothetical protein